MTGSSHAAAAAAQHFFALPEADKRRYHQPGCAGQRGDTPFGIETAKGASLSDLKEFWHVGRDLPAGHPFRHIMAENIWPDDTVPAFRPGKYFKDDIAGTVKLPKVTGKPTTARAAAAAA